MPKVRYNIEMATSRIARQGFSFNRNALINNIIPRRGFRLILFLEPAECELNAMWDLRTESTLSY